MSFLGLRTGTMILRKKKEMTQDKRGDNFSVCSDWDMDLEQQGR